MSNNLDRRNGDILTEQLEEQRNNFLLEVWAAVKRNHIMPPEGTEECN